MNIEALRALSAATGERVWVSDEMVAQARFGRAHDAAQRMAHPVARPDRDPR